MDRCSNECLLFKDLLDTILVIIHHLCKADIALLRRSYEKQNKRILYIALAISKCSWSKNERPDKLLSKGERVYGEKSFSTKHISL